VDVGVEVFELIERSFSPRYFANVLGAAVEVAAHVLDGDLVGVVDGDLLGSCEDQVLGDLYTELDRQISTPERP
jgi:hypothetical protein